MIGVLDYGIGNVGSIINMINKIGEHNTRLVHVPGDFEGVEKIILPGVGSFDRGMELINSSGLRDSLDYYVMDLHRPVLGICLGMQMLGKSSEEGRADGLGYVDFTCKKFTFSDDDLKVPHMGWDYVNVENPRSPLIQDIGDRPRFYFVHSYHAVCSRSEDVLLSCDYGYMFTAAVQHENVYGTQFHPEKSHLFGIRLLRNFIERVV